MKWCSSHLPILLLLSVLSLFISRAAGFRICAYNVQNFNPSKANNYLVLHTLTKVVSRCDICLLQHVVDPDSTAIKTVVETLNRYDEYQYQSVSSKSLGKSPDDMQQYVFIYRTNTVNMTGQHQYTKKNSFVREPFVVQFQSSNTNINEFILVPLHTDPAKAVQEIDWLYDVFEEVSTKWNNTNVMFLGDFHASCAYVTRQDRKNIRLYTDPNFSWLIGDREDTTVTDETNCAYDRIVVHGQSFLKEIVPFSGRVFNFGRRFKTSMKRVLELSDHFPVEVRLKGSALHLQATPLLSLLGVSVIVWSFLPDL
ncbi:deoxyribonuclease gamma-like [Melanotaenia boesemani]|uniref:deoxyribonuclease gamma-like n=1 Tax=Melanotaenia boesemani TaxID=1250792 RepID=UPI001C051006|nr:deoxyribonuclease gamma-like [Melanotaenia boesemani]